MKLVGKAGRSMVSHGAGFGVLRLVLVGGIGLMAFRTREGWGASFILGTVPVPVPVGVVVAVAAEDLLDALLKRDARLPFRGHCHPPPCSCSCSWPASAVMHSAQVGWRIESGVRTKRCRRM